VLIHFLAPHGKLYQRLLALEQLLGSIPLSPFHNGIQSLFTGAKQAENLSLGKRLSDVSYALLYLCHRLIDLLRFSH